MKKKYMNPYLAGTLLGIVLLMAMFPVRTGIRRQRGNKILCCFHCGCP